MSDVTTTTAGPAMRVLSLGAGVQSTALLLLAAENPKQARLDAAIFADTGWEPASVYAHLDRLEREVARPAGIPIYRVSVGNIRDDALDPGHRFASMPLHVKAAPGEPCPACAGTGTHPKTSGADGHDHTGDRRPAVRAGACCQCGGDGKARDSLGRRQCTAEYKLRPLREQVRRLLGAKPKRNGRPGRVRSGQWVEQWVGISADEADRALTNRSTRYARARFPLLEPRIGGGLTRTGCQAINRANGFEAVARSACVGCPFRTDAEWRFMRDNHPGEFADAVAFDHAIRHGCARAIALGKPLRGQMFLHRSHLSLDTAPIDRVSAREWARRQGDLFDLGEAEPRACSPFGCRIDQAREVA